MLSGSSRRLELEVTVKVAAWLASSHFTPHSLFVLASRSISTSTSRPSLLRPLHPNPSARASRPVIILSRPRRSSDTFKSIICSADPSSIALLCFTRPHSGPLAVVIYTTGRFIHMLASPSRTLRLSPTRLSCRQKQLGSLHITANTHSATVRLIPTGSQRQRICAVLVPNGKHSFPCSTPPTITLQDRDRHRRDQLRPASIS